MSSNITSASFGMKLLRGYVQIKGPVYIIKFYAFLVSKIEVDSTAKIGFAYLLLRLHMPRFQ